ncbi:MAG TPA: hypothetical protein VGN26_18315 [Armatimonadota bacterium]|jgi:hypothetical protein
MKPSLRQLALAALLTLLASPAWCQMQTGSSMKGFDAVFGVKSGERLYPYTVQTLGSTVRGGILFPGESGSYTFQLRSNLDQPLRMQGKVDVIAYGTRGIPGDIWLPEVFRIANVQSIPLEADVPVGGYQNLTVSPKLPERLGAYALVVDLGPHGRQFLTSLVRTFRPQPKRLQYPKFSLDHLPDEVLQRLGVQSIRAGVDWWLPTAEDGDRRMADLDRQMRQLQASNITVMAMIGASPVPMPLSRERPHLTDDSFLMATKSDYAWEPRFDPELRKWVARILGRYGWPKGPITAINLWNEPWEGLSISGWGADCLRYREIYSAMARGVEDARRDAKVQVLLAAADSSSNTLDKFFSDGKTDFLKWLDACTIHYQGMSSPANIKLWRERKSPQGRVRIWDTESWVANTDDRVAAVVATNRAAGYDRSMGIFGGNISSDAPEREVMAADGKAERIQEPAVAWPVAAAVGAMQHFLGERPFRRILYRNGLPWVYLFDGLAGKADDGCVVVVGDIGEEFGANNVLFRTVRSLKAARLKDAAYRRLRALPASAPAKTREGLRATLDRVDVRTGTLTLRADPAYSLYDFYGNPVPAQGGRIVVPLDHRGFFLRPSGAPGSYAKLVAALKSADLRGFEPVELIPLDLLAPPRNGDRLRIRLTNVLNRPVTGTLTGALAGRPVSSSGRLSLNAQETKLVTLPLRGVGARADNSYPCELAFDAGRDGLATHQEELHTNVIARRAITVDGRLDDWKGVPPQTVRAAKGSAPSLAEAAWYPFMKWDRSVSGGIATGYLAYDARGFYFAAKVADSTPDKGTVRFATRRDDSYFYPAVSYEADADATLRSRVARAAGKESDPSALQAPGGPGRLNAYWENTEINSSYAFDLHLPKDRVTQVALYVSPWDTPNGPGVRVYATDLSTGQALAEQHVDQVWKGAYVLFRLSGDVRLRVRPDGNWYTAKVQGLLFDSTSEPATGASASAGKLDFDTLGNWRGMYGASGHLLAGLPPKLPEGVSAALPEVLKKRDLVWPAGVRRYSYRRWPDLPAGNGSPAYDNVQIAFNVLPESRKTTLMELPGTMPRFTTYQDTDYEYALNKVAPAYGGGTEIWRLQVPGMPRKHFYPRQPKSPFDGPAKGGKLAIRQEGGTRIVECFLPWSELPEVKRALDTGRTIKFSYLVNDPGGPGQMELSRNRGVAKLNPSFHVDWAEHWANELEFAFQR